MLSSILRVLQILIFGAPIESVTFHSSLAIRDTANHEVTQDLSNLKENDFFIHCDFDEPVYVDFRINGSADSTLQKWQNGEWVLESGNLSVGNRGISLYNQYYANSFFPDLKTINIKSLKIRVYAVSSAPTLGTITIKSHGKTI